MLNRGVHVQEGRIKLRSRASFQGPVGLLVKTAGSRFYPFVGSCCTCFTLYLYGIFKDHGELHGLEIIA